MYANFINGQIFMMLLHIYSFCISRVKFDFHISFLPGLSIENFENYFIIVLIKICMYLYSLMYWFIIKY